MVNMHVHTYMHNRINTCSQIPCFNFIITTHTTKHILYLFRLGCPKVYLHTQVVTLLMPLHTTLKETEVLIMCPYVCMLHIHLELGKGFWSESLSWMVFQLVLLLLVSGQLQVPSKLLCYQSVTKKNLCISTYIHIYVHAQTMNCLLT